MVRTKIEINISALEQRTKTMNITVGPNTTSADVVRKIVEKFHLKGSTTKYQLLAVAKNDGGSQGVEWHLNACMKELNACMQFILTTPEQIL